MPDRSAIIILNIRSGNRYREKIGGELRAISATVGVECDVVHARTMKQVIRAARKAAAGAYDVVIAGGGDGTINAIACELTGSGKPLGVLPLGTFNYFARDLGLPTKLEDAFRACLEGEPVHITAGEVNGRMFLNNAGIGLYPIILSAREQAYRRWGRHRFAAYSAVLRGLTRRRLNLRLTITANGERRTVRTPLVFVARNALQLKDFQVPGTEAITENGFSVYVLKPLGKLGLLRLAWRLATGRLEPHTISI